MVWQIMKDELKFALIAYGVPFAHQVQDTTTTIIIDTAGISMLPRWSVVNLDTKNLVPDNINVYLALNQNMLPSVGHKSE